MQTMRLGRRCGSDAAVVLVVVALLGTHHLCNASSATSVNPWVVTQRLSLYETLLNATQFPPLFSSSNEGNILWGLPLQFKWQNESGRLMINNETGMINGKSWWACMNYYLSVVPYLGAMKAGLVANSIVIVPPSDNDPGKFCLTTSDCNQPLISKWTTYFQTVQSLQLGKTTMTVDDLMAVLWEAHTSSIVYAMDTFVEELSYLASDQEQKFGIGWGHFVQIIAAARFVTNETEVITMQVDLPFRMLQANDHPGKILDFTKNMNVACEAMFTIYETCNTTAYQLFLKTWIFAMKSPSCRADAQVLINNFFNNPVVEIIQMLGEMLILCSKQVNMLLV